MRGNEAKTLTGQFKRLLRDFEERACLGSKFAFLCNSGLGVEDFAMMKGYLVESYFLSYFFSWFLFFSWYLVNKFNTSV